MSLEEPLHLPQSKKMFLLLGLPFVSYFSKNQLKVLINFYSIFIPRFGNNSFIPHVIKGFWDT